MRNEVLSENILVGTLFFNSFFLGRLMVPFFTENKLLEMIAPTRNTCDEIVEINN
jgi:hypothetical protein